MSNLINNFHFNSTFKAILSLLLITLFIYYSLLVCASIAVIYALTTNANHLFVNQKIISLILMILWSFAGLTTSLAGLSNLIKFKWSTIITGIVAIIIALIVEYSLTIYGKYLPSLIVCLQLIKSFHSLPECSKLKVSAFAHIIIILQLILIITFTSIAFQLRNKSRRKKMKIMHIIGQEYALEDMIKPNLIDQYRCN